MRQLYDEFIAWMERQPKYKPKTIQYYREFCGSFADFFPGKVSRVKGRNVEEWIASKNWSQGTRSTAHGAVMRLFNWAVKQKLIGENTVRDAEGEPMVRREKILSVEQQDTFEAAAAPAFRDFLVTLRETGARPGTVSIVAAEDINFDTGLWEIKEHKTRHATGQAIVVAMTPTVREICERKCKLHPTGPIYRTVSGKPWDRKRVIEAFKRLRVKTGFGKEAVAYAYRHRFITEALRRGVDPVTVATLVGHKGMDMIKRFYAHYDAEQLQEAVKKATKR